MPQPHLQLEAEIAGYEASHFCESVESLLQRV
jgi:hypothetical protein